MPANMGTPAGDRMRYLLEQSTKGGEFGPNSSAFVALSQEGYGETKGTPEGTDDPEAKGKILSYAASAVLNYYASNLGKEMEMEEVHKKAWISWASVFLATVEEVNTAPMQRVMYMRSREPAGAWSSMVHSEGFLEGSAFGARVLDIENFVEGSHGDELKRAYCVALVSVFMARWGVGVQGNMMPELASYTLITSYFNHRAREFGEDADPNAPYMGLGTGGIERLVTDNYAPIFKEINIMGKSAHGVRATMFGFEDFTEIFQSPIDNQLEMDGELQTYRIEGELHYDEWWWYNTPSCEDTHVPVKNPQGKVTGYMNIGPTSFPCVDESRDVTPITGTAFARTFIEAPPISGTYDKQNTEYIQAKTRYYYPTANLGADLENGLEDYYEPADCTWITSHGGTPAHPITDASNYEPFYFVNNLENGAGSPFPGWQCNPKDGGYCEGGEWPYNTTMESCTSLGFNWANRCIHPAPPSPASFPGQTSPGSTEYSQVRDMSLRHILRVEDYDSSINYWDNPSSWEWTGFTMCPLEFTNLRFDTLYKDHYSNPVLDVGNLGRRAFSYRNTSTAQVIAGTCGPPQQFSNPNDSNAAYNMNGGPVVYAQVWAQNRTKRQQAKIGLFVGSPYRYSHPEHGTYDLHRTGGWNFPIIKEAYASNWADPVMGEINIEFKGNKISNNFNINGDRQYKYEGEEESFFMGTGIDPETNERYAGLWQGPSADHYPGDSSTPWLPYDPDPPDPWHYNQELITPHKFFGMGDGCVGIPTTTKWSLNAGQRYSYHNIDLTGVTHPYLKTITGLIASEVNDYTNGVEEFFKPGILGQHGDNYWDDFVTGWINTGHADHPYAGETVHCLHHRTGYSTTPGSYKTKIYHYLGTGQFDVHFNFPYLGTDSIINHGPLSPYPNISKCSDYFTPPFYGWTGDGNCYPTTTTTVDPSATTTTCDPMGMCTTTTEDVNAQYSCEDGIKVTCPDGDPPSDFYDSDIGFCNWDMCTMASCATKLDPPWDQLMWDSGIFPHERGWVEQKHRQRNENPPRYWYGPYASTHFTFLYPNAQAVLDVHYPSGEREEYPVTGFPQKITFDVTIKEYLVKDVVSGGYVDENGVITIDKILKSEEGHPAPGFTTGNLGQFGLPWDLVDENYVPLIERIGDWPPPPGESTPPYTKVPGLPDYHDHVVNHSLANGRNFHTYNYPTRFDRGNQVATGVTYGYGTALNNASYGQLHFPIGGYNRYSEYSFTQEATYARPTFTLDTLKNDPSSLVKALSRGNELFYDCGGLGRQVIDPNLGLDEWGNDIERDVYDYYDPIYFLPMESNLRETGVYNLGGLARDNEPFTGTLVHPKQIYGDRWMGLRPQSVFSRYDYQLESGYNGNLVSHVAGSLGDLVTAETGRHGTYDILYNSGYEPGCVEKFMSEMGEAIPNQGGGYWCETVPECYDMCSGVVGPPPAMQEISIDVHSCLYHEMTPEDFNSRVASDNRVWLFNLDASGVDMHVRAPDCLSGYISLHDGELPSDSTNITNMSVPENFLGGGGSADLASEISLAATAALGFRVTGTSVLWNPETSTAVAGGGNNQIDFFKRGWADDNDITFHKTIYEKEGLLYQKPSSTEWEMGKDAQGNVTGYETVLQHGARMAFDDPQNKLRVSGWKETSKVEITLSNFQITNYGAFPNDSYWTMQESGNCMVTGNLTQLSQAEASVYSEGITLEDKSDDPLKDILDYPNYASDLIKRPGVMLPSGDYSHGEYIPDDEIVAMKQVWPAPGRMMVRKIEHFIFGTGAANYKDLFKGDPYFYNRYIWPTRSDMSQWNGGEMSWEGKPSPDSTTYPLSELMISAQAGQPTPDAARSEFIQRKFAVTQHIAFYDGVVLDPTINKEWMVNVDTKFSIQPNTSYYCPLGSSVMDVQRGIVPARKHTLWADGTDSSVSEGDKEKVVGILT